MAHGRVLLVAGSDSSGGAGLEAGQKVLAAYGCYAMTATTALTAQNTLGLRATHPVPAAFVEEQMEACLEDVGADVVTTGMLTSAETIEVVAKQIVKHKVPALVVDPVMVSTSGAQLLASDAIKHLTRTILPLALIVTPNIPEAKAIISDAFASPCDPNSLADLESVGRQIQTLGTPWVLIKGGHLPFRADMTPARTSAEKKTVVDVLIGPERRVLHFKSPWQDSTSTHGTGCSLAAAISAGLAGGLDLASSVRSACRYVEAAICAAPKLGRGNGPLGHFHSSYHLPFSPGYFLEYLLGRPDVQHLWTKYTQHPFVMAIGNGTLPPESFKNYIIQDYLFLSHYCRAHSLAAYKAKSLEDMAIANEISQRIMQEMQAHTELCKIADVTMAEVQSTPEHQACTAYTRYVLDVGQCGDWLALQMALAPCLLGYGAVARILMALPSTLREGNPYWPWIETYAADDYVSAVDLGSRLLEKHAVWQSPSRIEELVHVFCQATQLEIGFWDMFPHH